MRTALSRLQRSLRTTVLTTRSEPCCEPLPSSRWLTPLPASAADPDAKQIDFFESKIRPVLVEHCYKCHSADADSDKKLRGGLRLDTKDGVLKGGDSGAAIVPGRPKDGTLLRALHYTDPDLQMPPKEKLPEEVIKDFEKWIADGAADPRGDCRCKGRNDHRHREGQDLLVVCRAEGTGGTGNPKREIRHPKRNRCLHRRGVAEARPGARGSGR